MTRNRFNQTRQASSNISLSPSKARQIFLEDNVFIDLKDTYKITNVDPPIDEKYVDNKENCDNNLLSSSNKRDILRKNITKLRKGDFDKTFVESTNEVTNTVKFCNKVADDTISKIIN